MTNHSPQNFMMSSQHDPVYATEQKTQLVVAQKKNVQPKYWSVAEEEVDRFGVIERKFTNLATEAAPLHA